MPIIVILKKKFKVIFVIFFGKKWSNANIFRAEWKKWMSEFSKLSTLDCQKKLFVWNMYFQFQNPPEESKIWQLRLFFNFIFQFQKILKVFKMLKLLGSKPVLFCAVFLIFFGSLTNRLFRLRERIKNFFFWYNFQLNFVGWLFCEPKNDFLPFFWLCLTNRFCPGCRKKWKNSSFLWKRWWFFAAASIVGNSSLVKNLGED